MIGKLCLAGALLMSAMTIMTTALGWGQSGKATDISSITFATPFIYNGLQASGRYLSGDTFGNTWADNGSTYTLVNDTYGADGVGPSSNMAIGTLSTFDSTMVWTVVSRLAQWGTITQNTGSPSGSHKTGGLISIGGVFYTVAWRLAADNLSGFDGQLIKSTDHGSTWSPQPSTTAAPLTPPVMWPGYDMPLGWVQYGQDYTGTGPDNSATYVYALVRYAGPPLVDGFPRLARVPVASIQNQIVADWTYWQGGDGMVSGNWGPLATAKRLVGSSTTLSSMQYLPRYKKYVMFSPTTRGANGIWDVYFGDHPWGEWRQVGVYDFGANVTTGLGFPFIAPKSLVNGGQTLAVLGSGGASNPAGTVCGPTHPTVTYCLWSVGVTFGP